MKVWYFNRIHTEQFTQFHFHSCSWGECSVRTSRTANSLAAKDACKSNARMRDYLHLICHHFASYAHHWGDIPLRPKWSPGVCTEFNARPEVKNVKSKLQSHRYAQIEGFPTQSNHWLKLQALMWLWFAEALQTHSAFERDICYLLI